uniref:Suppressor of white apricot N-terminal domain-containing protein n=1 Tax=Knipowitschia caucasica TaxID=637954 RepID=A0AAV2IZ81_KNICA
MERLVNKTAAVPRRAPTPSGAVMWQEARKHERKLRGMMVDYKRRGERRREYYEKIKKDPAQFLQVHGRSYKIHLDPAVALAAESPINMMPWQVVDDNTPEHEMEDRKCNYERYRGLVQNDFANISEEQCLYQIYLDELYGGLPKPNEDEKKKLAEKKANIGYIYEDSTVTQPEPQPDKEEDDSENSESEEDEGIPDIDVEVDVDELNDEQLLDLNKIATPYGMAEGDFVRMLRKDKEEVEAIKHAKALEAEKAMYSGRRSRRQRREFREKRLKGRQISPPSYARRDSPTYDPYKRPESESSSESRSRSRTPGPEKITFITSFGGSDEEAPVVALPAAPQSAHNASNAQHPAGRSRGSRRQRSSSSASSSSDSSSNSSSGSSSHSRHGAPDLTHGAEALDPGGDVTGQDLDPMIEAENGIETGEDALHIDAQDHAQTLDNVVLHVVGVAAAEETADQSLPVVPPTAPLLLIEGYSPPPLLSLISSESLILWVVKRLEPPKSVRITPQERLKLRMQKALNKQSKADKKAAQVKIQQQENKRQEREGELRAMARKIRMKERERRERERDEWERQYGRESRSPSPSKYSREHDSPRRSRSRSRSPYYRH